MSVLRPQKVLVLGVTGMLGNAVLRVFCASQGFCAVGTARSPGGVKLFPEHIAGRVLCNVDVENIDKLVAVFASVKPDVVINCVGLVKQAVEVHDPLAAIPINGLLPHRLARLSDAVGARLVHISTDCVFQGTKGMYCESDVPDALDLYGRSKLLGEVDYPNAITLRTSMIGHEVANSRSLVGWFLAQSGRVKGFTRAIFSGLTVVSIARVIRDFVIPHPELRGVYHLSAEPITKYDLLKLISAIYGNNVEVVPDDALVIDRSLDSSRFRAATGFVPDTWPDMIQAMHDFKD